MGLTQRLYFFITGCVVLLLFVMLSLFWSWQTINLALSRFDYTEAVGIEVDQLERMVLVDGVYSLTENTNGWIDGQQALSQILQARPSLTPHMQTLHNSIMSQNKSMSILYQRLVGLAENSSGFNVKMHLAERLLIQMESIREDVQQLSSIVSNEIRAMIKLQLWLAILVLLASITGLGWGIYSIKQLLKLSIKEIQKGLAEYNEGRFARIDLSVKSTEFSSFVDKLNEMSQRLSETTVSRDKLQQIVDERTDSLRKLSVTDPLTGIANRRAIFERGKLELFRLERNEGELSLLLLDCDFFKNLNDTHGHLVGDKTLQHLAKVCQKEVREVDFIGRYGGEEFIILLPQTGRAGAIENSKRIQRALQSNTLLIAGKRIEVTVSIGIAITSGDGITFEELINDADKAMYLAKQKGRDRVEVASPPS